MNKLRNFLTVALMTVLLPVGAQPYTPTSSDSRTTNQKIINAIEKLLPIDNFVNTPHVEYNVIPQPQSVTYTHKEVFIVNDSTQIGISSATLRKDAEWLANYIRELKGVRLIVEDHPVARGINLVAMRNNKSEGYRLSVTTNMVEICGSPTGIFYGIQTLRKSIPYGKTKEFYLPTAIVEDAPRFGYRGAHLDVARHFYPVEEVKRFIDIMALHNLNRFHWHLTDDQGWRVEIKSRPELTKVGAWRNETLGDGTRYGGFYTQDEIRDIVSYAAAQHITVIPEIDMPGHMQAALAAYPELGCTGGPYGVWSQWGVSDNVLCVGNDSTLKFIDDVLGEIVQLFPSEYIHIGGDECPKVHWEHCAKCQARIKALGLKTDSVSTAEQKLQSFVLAHAENFLQKHGRHVIGWDEILEGGLTPDASVMSWRGSEGGIEAARLHHKAIMTPISDCYFSQTEFTTSDEDPYKASGFLPLERVYNFNPIPKQLNNADSSYIIGLQSCLWGEHIRSFKQAEFLMLPRLAALSEVAWSAPSGKNYHNFLKRLAMLTMLYDSLGYNHSRLFEAIKMETRPDVKRHRLAVTLSTYDNALIQYSRNGSDPEGQFFDKYVDGDEPIYFKKSGTLRAVVKHLNGHKDTLSENIVFNKATLHPIKLAYQPSPSYTFDGAETLIDGILGKANYKTGRWLGFQLNKLDAVIDLQKAQTITEVSFNNFVLKGDWIMDAKQFDVEVSVDGKHYTHMASATYPMLTADSPDGIYHHKLSFTPVKARYVRVVVKPWSQLPSWHLGKGNPAFIFVDELCVE
ncbi:MAG: family 20 glycosylhydrolase [Prevotella sp.]|jgi:hexosaminidase